MTAYTPGDTLGLPDRPEVAAWRTALGGMGVPRGTRLVVLMPCAKTKPWADAPRRLYRAYNRIRADRPAGVFFATVSEPLGIVPETRWADFPAYDNPGLSSCTVMPSGRFTQDGPAAMGRIRRRIPYDPTARAEALARLGETVGAWIRAQGHPVLAFVDDGAPGTAADSTHEIMIGGAAPTAARRAKRPGPRQDPESFLRREIARALETSR